MKAIRPIIKPLLMKVHIKTGLINLIHKQTVCTKLCVPVVDRLH